VRTWAPPGLPAGLSPARHHGLVRLRPPPRRVAWGSPRHGAGSFAPPTAATGAAPTPMRDW